MGTQYSAYRPSPRYMLIRNVKLVDNIEIGLITKIVGIIALTPSAQW